MLIKNFSDLASSEERKDALEIVDAGISAVLTKNAMRKYISLNRNILKVKGQDFDLNQYERIFVIGGGKAAADMAEEIENIMGDFIEKGIVADIVERKLEKIEVVKGSHPLPSQANADACDRMVEIAREANENDLVIALISGGGSAMLASSRASLENSIAMNQALLKSGADIYEMNAVRKHISRIKGGQLSQIAYPATLVSVIFSDVLGNDLSVIASGPSVKDKSTMEEVKEIIQTYNLPELDEGDFAETPKEDKWFSKTHNILLLDNSVAVSAMQEKAQELGYNAEIQGYELNGEAREVGKSLAEKIRPGVAIIAAGETTVTVKGNGKGGRNQELAMGSLGNFRNNGVVVSAGTDGRDNTDAAGAVVDDKSLEKAQSLNLNPHEFLQNNDAFHFFEKMNDLIITGPTGTNVADIMLALGKD